MAILKVEFNDDIVIITIACFLERMFGLFEIKYIDTCVGCIFLSV